MAASQPLISVVMPVYQVREYLGECLDSVLADAGAGPAIELIAVDDASTDGSGALLAERARQDKRLTVIRTERTAGPGNARNTGLARAAGTYVWFVDPDDLLAPGALRAVAATLGRLEPDVLLIGYEQLYPDGSTGPAPDGPLLGSLPGGVFRIAQAPAVVNLTMTSWSKVLRREFLAGLDEPFRPGIHEDIPVSSAALLAGRLGTLPRVCYRYRRRRPGSFMASSSRDHLAIFDSYADVLAMVAKRLAGQPSTDAETTSAVQAAFFERAIWHYAAVLQAGRGVGPLRSGAMVPGRDRKAFFRRMHADYVRHAPPGYRAPGGARGAKLRLVARDAYLAYELLEPLNRLRIWARGLRSRRMVSSG
jgi:glycosyltransferase involved in cell wall biosynthesis